MNIFKTFLSCSFVAAAAMVICLPAQAEPTAPAARPAQGPDLLLGLLADLDRPLSAELLDLLSERQGEEQLVQRLRELISDSGQSRYVRVRATTALGYFASAENRSFLERLARTADDREVRIQAVVAVGHGFWKQDPEGVRRWLEKQTLVKEQGRAEAARRTLQRLETPERPRR